MTREILLHIGTSKTGTTALQASFCKSSELLGNHSTIYPLLLEDEGFNWKAERGLGTGNGDVFEKNQWSKELPCMRVTKLLQEALNQFDSYTRYLFSSENLSVVATKECFWTELKQFSVHHKVDVKVIMYLRDPFSYFLSCYIQAVKLAGFTGSLSDFKYPFFKTESPLTFHVYENIGAIHTFAKENAIPLFVQRYEQVASNIIEHFYSSYLKIRPIENSELGMRFNQSLDPIDVEFHRGINAKSIRLGELIGWQRSDFLFLASNPRTIFGEMHYEFNHDDESYFNNEVNKYRLVANKVLDFAGNIDFSTTHKLVSQKLSDEQVVLYAKIRDLGELLGSSFEHGYIAWDRQNKIT